MKLKMTLMGNGYTFKEGDSVNTDLPPFSKGVHSTRQEFAPSRADHIVANFFPVGWTHFQKGFWSIENQRKSKVISLVKNGGKSAR